MMTGKFGLALAGILMTVSLAPLWAQEDHAKPDTKNRRPELVAKLRSDLNRATLNPDTGEKQRAKLEKINEKLAEAEAALRKGGVISPLRMLRMLKMRGAINDLEKLAEEGVFATQDGQLVLDDIHNLKQNRPPEGAR